MRATHIGSCQICGCTQMLPAGRLSLHGYTVRWGFFTGKCTGSRELPFEVSIGLILDAIERSREAAASLRREASRLRATSEGNHTYVHAYHAATWKDRTSRTELQLVTIEPEEVAIPGESRTYLRFNFTVRERQQNGEMRDKRETWRDYSSKTLADVIRTGNEVKARELDRLAAKHDGYVQWQTERITGWTPKPLKERV